MRKLFLVVSVLLVLSLAGCAAAPNAVSALANLGRSAAPAAQAQATAAPTGAAQDLVTPAAVVPSTQATAQANTSPAVAPAAQNVPAGIADLQNTLSGLYSSVSPSVVNINVLMSLTGGQNALPDIPQHRNGPGLGSPQAAALGSGFVWDNQGHIVTNNHVVESATRISVTFADGQTLPAELVGRDPQSDLAVIKIDPAKVDKLQPVTLGDSTAVKVGQFVVAIGNPFGLEGSMTFGIVSALGRTLPVDQGATTTGSYTIPDIIQTDAPVNPGNSGGVLIDMTGRLIGVPTAIESQSGTSSGVGFAVPSVIVQKVVPELINSGSFQHPYIGIRGGTLNSQVAEAMGLPATTRGALVVEVTTGSPAEKAGLKGSTKTTQIDGLDAEIGGDVITAVNGQPIRDFEDLTTYLARSGKVGDQLNLTVLRNGATQSVTVTLAARPDETTTAQAPTTRNTPTSPLAPSTPETQPGPSTGRVYLGVTGMTVTPEIAQAMNLGKRAGVLVVNVVPGSPAEAAGLKGSDRAANLNGQQMMVGGDVITAVDGQALNAVEDLVAAVQAKQAGDTITLTILRNGQEQTVTATLAARGAAGQGGTAPSTPSTPVPTATPQAPATQQQGTATPQATTAMTQTMPTVQATPSAGAGGAAAPAVGGPWLGVNGVTLSAQMTQMMGLGDQTGVLLMNVVPGSPAERAGLKGVGVAMGQGQFVNADIIVAIDGKAITTMNELTAAIQAKKVGDTITLTVLRNGQRQDVTATLGARPAQ